MLTLMVIGGAAGLVGWRVRRSKARALAKASSMAALLGASEGFQPMLVEAMCGGDWGLALDPTNNRLAIGEGSQRRVFNFEQIIAVEALVDGQPVGTQSGAGMTGALLGGALAGTAGAVAGMMMTSGRIQRLSLRILNDDLAQPWHEVLFLNEKHPQFQSHKRVKAAMAVWNDWNGRLMTIAARHPQTVAVERPIRAFVS